MTSDLVFASDGTALSAISGLYADMGNDYFSSGGSRSVTILAGISSDELQVYFSGLSFYEQFSRNAVNPSEALALPHLWSTAYSTNYRAKSKTVTSAIKRQLEGESRFIRAFCFFYLVNLFGDVPLITTTDYNVNKNAPRTEQVAIYDQMISDLLKAKELLSIDYSSAERIQSNRRKGI